MRSTILWLAAGVLAAAPAGADELVVAAAVSLSEPLQAIARRFEAEHPGLRVQLALGASNALLAQAKAGAPIDVFVAADAESIDALAAAGLMRAGSRTPIAGNRLVVLTAARLPVRLERAADLARPELRRIAVAEPNVPLGRYTREWIAREALLEALAPRLLELEHARATLTAVETGDVDAAIVYASDARLARSARIAFSAPEANQPHIVYVAAQLDRSRAPALAQAFLAALSGAAARRDLAAAGLTPPPANAGAP
jgi:molybdate transport system substrate-binding protein